MKFYRYSLLFLMVGFLACPLLTSAQNLPVGTPVLEDYYRRAQLTGSIDTNISFTVRPFTQAALGEQIKMYDPQLDLPARKAATGAGLLAASANGKMQLQLLPLTWLQQVNTRYPYGWNDGPMIPAKGYQTLISGGMYARLGRISIQLRPELVYAKQSNFTGFASGHGTDDLRNYYAYYNGIDAPERFGEGSYTKLGWGQSHISVDLNAVSVSLSTENLWWGPGVRNALVMTNNAPGFKHLSLQTNRPLQTGVGTFEGQIIAGRLDGTNLPPLGVAITAADSFYRPKRNDWRYLTGFNISYQPKWTPGLFVGVTQLLQAYHGDMSGVAAYVPVVSRFQHPGYERDQIMSVYARWLFAKVNAEIYAEYGWNDYTSNFVVSPDHSRAYLVGLRKLFPLSGKPGQAILFSTELTQLSQSTDRLDNPAGGWYTHYTIRQGLTNRGQVLGAGTGSGGNLQSAEISWVKGLKKLGIVLERYEHSVDFALSAFPAINAKSRKWVDVGLALQGEWNYRNWLFNAKIQPIKSYNYQWILDNYTPDAAYRPNNNASNLYAQLGTTFRF